MNWWVTSAMEGGVIVLGSWVFWVIFSICLHELAHGYAAIWQGDDTPRATGHMTWNPLVHMGPTSLLFFAILGIAWGAMPVNPYNFRSRYGDAIVAVAGPLTNALLMILCVIGSVVWVLTAGGVGEPYFKNVLIFFELGAMLNAVLMVFNLLPVPPLDGSKILADFVPSYGRLWEGEKGAIVGLMVFALVFFYSGSFVFKAGQRVVDTVERVIVNAVAPASGTRP
ncbi:MAG TPA: site-2 protease family protein [Phycisphaerales bacterium]